MSRRRPTQQPEEQERLKVEQLRRIAAWTEPRRSKPGPAQPRPYVDEDEYGEAAEAS